MTSSGVHESGGSLPPTNCEQPTILMCPPTYFDSTHLFNPWMDWRDEVDHGRAVEEWEQLRERIEGAGARVEVIQASPDSGAMTFTRDAALVPKPGLALVLRNDGPRGVDEPPLFRKWFRQHGYQTEGLPPDYHLDGGNLVRRPDGLRLIGMKPGSEGRAERYLGKLLHRLTADKSVGIPLVNREYLHLDMVLGDLDGRGWLLHRDGLGNVDLNHPEWRKVLGDVPIFHIDEHDAAQFACNVLVIRDTVITSHMSRDVEQQVKRLGFEVVRSELREFHKAGGGIHCLTLEI